MRRLMVVLFIVLVMSVPAFAVNPHNDSNATATATATATGGAGGAGGNATLNDNSRTYNTNTNLNTNAQGQNQNQGQLQDQQQGQIQGQLQGQKQTNVNDQVIAPNQEVTFKSPTQLLAPPSQGVPELNFGNGKMKDVTGELPNFAMYGIKRLGTEPILRVLNVNANVKFKNLYKEILEDAKDVVNGNGNHSSDIRYQVIRAEAQKSWTTGGNIGGAGSGVATSGLAGGSMAGSVIPQWGGTKADDLFTIIFVRVATPAQSK